MISFFKTSIIGCCYLWEMNSHYINLYYQVPLCIHFIQDLPSPFLTCNYPKCFSQVLTDVLILPPPPPSTDCLSILHFTHHYKRTCTHSWIVNCWPCMNQLAVWGPMWGICDPGWSLMVASLLGPIALEQPAWGDGWIGPQILIILLLKGNFTISILRDVTLLTMYHLFNQINQTLKTLKSYKVT